MMTIVLNIKTKELTSKRMEPFLSMSNALNRKCAYMVASENVQDEQDW